MIYSVENSYVTNASHCNFTQREMGTKEQETNMIRRVQVVH
jgi:hypothetical protein